MFDRSASECIRYTGLMLRFSLTGASVRCAIIVLTVLVIGCATLLLPDTTRLAYAQTTRIENPGRTVWVDPDLLAAPPDTNITDSSTPSTPTGDLPSWGFIETASDPDRPNHSLLVFQVVEQMLHQGHVASARRLLDTINREKLDHQDFNHLRLLDAKILYMAGDYKATLQSLQKLRPSDLTPRQQANTVWLRMAGLLGLQRIPEALTASRGLQPTLTDEDIYTTGYWLLWKTLESLPMSKLAELQTAESNPETIAWADLTEMITVQTQGGDTLSHQLQNWKLRNPSHPANRYVIKHLVVDADSTKYRPQQVALLLPLTSAFEQAAKAVRDGFLTLWRKNPSENRPKIRIYDYGDQTDLVNAYYDAALRDQVDFIIGPLGTEAVQKIAQRQSFAIPTLLLGNLDPHSVPRSNTYQFSLAPEDEATAVARRAFADGHRQASALYPDTARGSRIFASWSQAWRDLGGVITESKPYDVKVTDHTHIIRTLLNLDHSTARRTTLQTSLGNSALIKFSSRRRQDIDALFLFGDSDQIRLMKPQIDFHHAHELPVYGLSSIYNGKSDPVKDLDLENIVFGDMPWLLIEGGQVESLRGGLTQNKLNTGTGMERLFALGVDSFALIDKVKEMQRNPDRIYSGITGSLSVTGTGKIWRHLEWARIKDAKPLHLRLATLPAPPRLKLTFASNEND